jgi:RNA polymerase sigma-70 factor (ECF subfamily)
MLETSGSQPPKDGDKSRSISTTLLEGLRSQDDEAWHRVLDAYVPYVFSCCRRAGLQSADAADVVQEVFQAVFRAIEQFQYRDPHSTFRGWLATITQNKIRDHFKRNAGRPAAEGGTGGQQRMLNLSTDEDPSSFSGPGPLGAALQQALHSLRGQFSELAWEAFRMTAIDGRSSAEAAEHLGTNPHAVRQAKYRVMRRLRQELGDLA